MKLWEALREMDRGAVCEHGDCQYRVVNGQLEAYWGRSWHKAVHGLDFYLLCDWSIHTPAPSAAPEPGKAFDPVEHLRNGGKVRYVSGSKVLCFGKHDIIEHDGANCVAGRGVLVDIIRCPEVFSPVRETFGFAEAVKHVCNGKAVSRVKWNKETHLSSDVYFGVCPEDIDATDYYVLEDEK